MFCACLIALWIGGAPSSTTPDEPRLVVLPLEVEGVKAQLGLDAWNIVVDEITKSKSKIHVNMSQQAEIHGLLLGPARERARDCGGNAECLRDIGATLEVNVLVAGKVTKDTVSLTALDVATGQRIALARSPASLASATLERRARAAVNVLVQAMLRSRAKKAEDAKAAPSEETPAIDAAAAQATEPSPRAAGAGAETAAAAAPKATSPSGIGIGTRTGTRTGTGPETGTGPGTGGGTGPGTGGGTGAGAGTALVPTAAPPEQEDVTSRWWFWAGIGAAVLAGGLTAAFLFGGTKGGPAVPSETGRIMGTY
jgi:hypothetical protein